MVDITKFFIIDQVHFDRLIEFLKCNLDKNDNTYLLSYIVTNIFGYIVIVFCLYIILTMYYQIFSKRKGAII